MRFLKTLTVLAVSCSLALPPAGAYAQLAGGVGEFNLPSLGNVAGADLTVLEERNLGEQLMRRVRADRSYMPDPEITDFINRLGYRLVAAANPSPYDFFFFPIRDKSLNAFALPGGFIAVHTGLIVAAQTESELAGVIGHEIGHVTQRHIARMIESSKGSLAMTIGSILLALLAARAGGSSGGDAAMGVMLGTQAAMLSKQLGYSRDAEREADVVVLAKHHVCIGTSKSKHDLSGLSGHRLRSHGSLNELGVPFIMNRPLNEAYKIKSACEIIRNRNIFEYLINGTD